MAGSSGHTGSGSASETSRTFLLCARGGPEFSPPEKELPRNSRHSGVVGLTGPRPAAGLHGGRWGTVRAANSTCSPPSAAQRPALRAPCPQQWPLRPAWSPHGLGEGMFPGLVGLARRDASGQMTQESTGLRAGLGWGLPVLSPTQPPNPGLGPEQTPPWGLGRQPASPASQDTPVPLNRGPRHPGPAGAQAVRSAGLELWGPVGRGEPVAVECVRLPSPCP